MHSNLVLYEKYIYIKILVYFQEQFTLMAIISQNNDSYNYITG